jgi:transcriptional regulator with XRE-family HTH domain
MDSNLQADICARIKQARIEAGFTQQEAADTLGVTMRAYQNYEATRVPFRSLTRIADVFDVPERWLLHGGDQSEQPSTLALLQELREAVDVSAGSTAEALQALAAGIARIEARLPAVAVRRRKAG